MVAAPVALPEQPIARASKDAARRLLACADARQPACASPSSSSASCATSRRPACSSPRSGTPSSITTKTGWWEGLINLFARTVDVRDYDTVMGSVGMGAAFLNSLIVTIPSTVDPVTIAAFAAYAFASIHSSRREYLFIIVVALLSCRSR